MEPKAKTKIWHGGLQALLAGVEGGAAAKEEAAPTAKHVATQIVPATAAKRGATQIMPGPAAMRGATQIGSAPFAVQAAIARATPPPRASQVAVARDASLAPASPADACVSPPPAGLVTPSSWQAVTRVLPIEQVFPQASAANPAAAAQAAASSASASPATATGALKSEFESMPLDLPASWPPLTLGARLRASLAARVSPGHGSALAGRVRRISAKVGRERLVLYGGMLGLVTALLVLRVARGAVAEPGEQPALETPAAQETAAQTRTVRSSEELVESKAPTASTSHASKVSQGVERAAADALARGDYAAAQRIYAELAKSMPEPSAYSEAARILNAAAQPAPR